MSATPPAVPELRPGHVNVRRIMGDPGGRARREAFLEAFAANGADARAACAAVGVTYGTYRSWRKRWPEFANRVEATRARVLAAMATDPAHRRMAVRAPVRAAPPGPDFASWRRLVFGQVAFEHHLRIIEAIETCPPQGVVMVLAPPESGKTTLLEDWICWALARDPDLRIGIVGESRELPRKMLARIRARMEDPAHPLSAWGPWREPGQERHGRPWGVDAITVARRSGDERDRSVTVFGVGSPIYGARIDLLLADDICSPLNVSRSRELAARFRQNCLTRLGTTGRCVIVGSVVGARDFYELMEEAVDEVTGEPVVGRVVRIPALDAEGRSYWPALWPPDALRRKRTLVGEEVWWRSYMQRPRVRSQATFVPAEMAACRDETLGLRDTRGVRVAWAALDPALGGGCAVVAVGLTGAGRLRVLDAAVAYGLQRTAEIVELVASVVGGLDVAELVVETVGFQRHLATDRDMAALAERLGFRVVPHLTGVAGTRKADPVFGVAQMSTSFRDRVFELPWDPAARERLAPLVDQLTAWSPEVPTRHLTQDLVMALWMAWLQRDRMSAAAGADLSAWRQARPFRPTAWRRPA